MTTQDWPVVLFQISFQGGVGAFLVLGVMHTLSHFRHEYEREYTRIALVGFGTVFALVGIGLILSWFHVTQMLRVFTSAQNLGSSWMAREVVFSVAFLGMVAVTIGLLLIPQVPHSFRLGWGILTGLVGLMAVTSMGMIYMLNTRPAWNTPSTMMTFLTTTALLGLLTAGFVAGTYHLVARQRDPGLAAVLGRDYTVLSMLTAAALIAQGINLGSLASYLSTGPQAARDAYDILINTHRFWFWLRVAAGLMAPLLIVASIWWMKGREAVTHAPAFVPRIAGAGPGASKALLEVPAHRWMFAAFALVLGGELTARFLFYLAVVPVTP
jgi:anaerobic dimethyl sulfoxide reductase subunit C (anchor subunit)